MTEGANATPGPAALKKEKGPRKVGTKIAAAMKIAGSHANPSVLLEDMASPEQTSEKLAREQAQIVDAENALISRRAALRDRKQFAEEIAGLPALDVVGIKAVLTERVKAPAV